MTESIESSMKDVLPGFSDVPVEWVPPMPHQQLAQHLRNCNVFALLSLEEGMARTALEAMACGLPVVLTPNTGTADLVKPGINGEIVPIRDSEAAAKAIIACHERQLRHGPPQAGDLLKELSFQTFSDRFTRHLSRLGLIDGVAVSDN